MRKAKTREELLSREKVGAYELAHLTAIPYSTVRLYTEKGLLPFTLNKAVEVDNSFTSIAKKRDHKRYDTNATLKRLREIDKLKGKRYTLDEIKKHFKETGGE